MKDLDRIQAKNTRTFLDALLVLDQLGAGVVPLVQGQVDQDVPLDALLEQEGVLATRINNLPF